MEERHFLPQQATENQGLKGTLSGANIPPALMLIEVAYGLSISSQMTLRITTHKIF